MIWYLTIGVIYVMSVTLCQRKMLMEFENMIFEHFEDNKLSYFIGVFALYALLTTVGVILWPVSIISDVYVILKRVVR